MGQTYSTKPKQSRKSRNIQSGNFIILVDPDDIFDRSVLEKSSVITVNASYATIQSRLPLDKTMSKDSFPSIFNLRKGQQSSLRNRRHNKHKKHGDSEIELASLSLSQQQKREEKIKKVCTCKFIITSDISNHEKDCTQKLKPTHSCVSEMSQKISGENICKDISENLSTYRPEFPKSINKFDSLYKQVASKQPDRRSNKRIKIENTENTKANAVPTAAFYKYENSKITMLSSVVRIPTQERLKREFGGPLSEKGNSKEIVAKHSSESLNELLENTELQFSCPFCGATSSSLFTPENLAKLSSLKPSKTFFKKPDGDDEYFMGDPEKSLSLELLKLRKKAKQKPTQEEYVKSKKLKKSKASTANIIKPLRDDATSTPSIEKSRNDSFDTVSEKLLSKQYTPEKLYISLKRNEKALKERNRCKKRSITKTVTEDSKNAETCKEEPQKQNSEQVSFEWEDSTDESSLAMDENILCKFSENNLIKPSLKPKETYERVNPNLKRSYEKKTYPVPGKPYDDEIPKTTSNQLTQKSVKSKLDKLTLQRVNKSSFKPLGVSYVPDLNCCDTSFKQEKSKEKQLEKPSKIILEISGSALPKDIMEQLTKSNLKTYISSNSALPEELLKPLSTPPYQDILSKQVLTKKNAIKNQNRLFHQPSMPKKTTSEPNDIDMLQQVENLSKMYNKSTTHQLTQTNTMDLPKATTKHLGKSQVFLSTTKTQPARKVSQTFFEELHKFPKQTRSPNVMIKQASCCGKLQNNFTEKLEDEGSTVSTSGESMPSDRSEASVKSFVSDPSDASKTKTRSKYKPNSYEYKMMKKKQLLKQAKEYLTKIKEISPNGSLKSLSSSASDVSLTVKEKRLLNKQSLSDHSLRKSQDLAKHKLQVDELEMHTKPSKKMTSFYSTALQDANLSTPGQVMKHRISARSKSSDMTKEQDLTQDFTKHKNKPSYVFSEEASSLEDFREPSAFQQEHFQENQSVSKATGEPDTSFTLLSSSSSSRPRRASILKQTNNESKPNKGVSPVTFRKACYTETVHYPDKSEREPQMVCRSNPSDSELSQILEEPSEEEIQEIIPLRLLTNLRSSEKFMRIPSSTSFYDVWKYDEDPSVKFVQLLEKTYNRKFSTINELMEKPPKELILFIRKGELQELPEVTSPIKHPIDYKNFLSSMTSGV